MELEEKVLLLALAKRHPGEGTKEVLFQLENAGALTLKEGKKLLKKLKADGLLSNEELTFAGVEAARAAEAEFKLP